MRSGIASITGIITLLLACNCAGADGPAQAKRTPACKPPEGPVERPDYCSYPADVRAFLDERDACDYFRGEPWSTDEELANANMEERASAIERRKDIEAAIKENCTGTDKRLAKLKARHAGAPDILRVLGEYEDDIEPNR